MTATLAHHPTHRAETPRAGEELAAGLGLLVLFVLRRNWLRMLIWTLVLAGMTLLVIRSQAALFPTQADRDAYAAIANTPAVAGLTGLPYAAGTLGGILNIKIWMTNAVALAFAAVFLVTRNGRAEEEAGRTEILRAGALGVHAYSLANWLVVGVFTALVGLACGLGAIAMGLPVEGSLLMGASYMSVALAFLGVAALTGQLADTSRQANALAAVAIAIAYLLRAAADLQAEGERASWLTWLSPIGWGQQTRSFGENLWWPLVLGVGTCLALCALALLIERRRDVGAGILPDRPGPARAAALTRTPVGLVLRLQRASLIGWTLGTLVGALFFGTVATAMSDLLDGSGPLAQAFLGQGEDVLTALLGYFAMALALVVGAFAVQSVDHLRAEETSGRAEIPWSGALSRVSWALARIAPAVVGTVVLLAFGGAVLGAGYGATVDDASQVGRMASASLSYAPAVLVVIGVGVLAAGWIPRQAGAVVWAVYGIASLLAMFGHLLDLPEGWLDLVPFTAVPVLGDEPEPLTLVLLGLVGAAFGVLGLWRLRTRDMVGG